MPLDGKKKDDDDTNDDFRKNGRGVTIVNSFASPLGRADEWQVGWWLGEARHT